ncbi:hypothetical protein [Methyloterricola oryzae]|nr:hypothetical protein [Methyloterricola oryzae]
MDSVFRSAEPKLAVGTYMAAENAHFDILATHFGEVRVARPIKIA